jgi:murein DD-endopeptidase MepM/ murein hydrolase activator NlpD
LSSHASAVRSRCYRALAPALLGLIVFIGAAASNAADFPAGIAPGLLGVNPPAPLIVPPPPAPPPAFEFASPLPGREIGSPFGLRRLPWEPTGRLHEGVDMAAPSGSAVHATCAGVVARTGSSASYGRFVEVTHADGFSSFYAHLGRVAKGIRSGTPVAEGDTVGAVGDTGHSTGAHLHFELRKDGQVLNPAMFIGRVFVKLADLPLKAARLIPRHVHEASVSSAPGWTLASDTVPRRHFTRGGRVHAVLAAAD